MRDVPTWFTSDTALIVLGILATLEIVPSGLQEVPAARFRELGAGDILFIDSTHVSKTGSDVNRLLFEVLPSLAAGVYVHFHDVQYPFERENSPHDRQ